MFCDYYGCLAAMLAESAILFRCWYLDISFFSFAEPKSPKSLGRTSPNFPTCSMVTHIYKILSEMWDPSPTKFGYFSTRSWSSPERNKIWSHGKRCDHSRTCLLYFVDFSLQTAKKNQTGVSTYPTGRYGRPSRCALPRIVVNLHCMIKPCV